jgi:exosortase
MANSLSNKLDSDNVNTRTQSIQLPTDSVADEIRACWRLLPNKGLFFGLTAVWLLLFQFLGNSSFGYIPSPSLFNWMYVSYNRESVVADDGHGNFIPFLVMGLMWWKREELLSQPIKTWWPALLLVAAGLVAHLAGFVVQQQRLSIIGLFTGLYGLMGVAWGPRWLKASFFPFFLLVFMVPLGSLTEPLTFPLRIMVSWIVQHLFSGVFGIGVIRQGTELLNSLGTYKYEVAAACSGMRSLISIFLVSVSYAFLVFHSPWKRLAMIAASLPLAVVGNVVRLGSIVAAGELSGQGAGNYVHESSLISMLPYVPAFLGMMYIGRWLEKSGPDGPKPTAESKVV